MGLNNATTGSRWYTEKKKNREITGNQKIMERWLTKTKKGEARRQRDGEKGGEAKKWMVDM